MNKTFGQLYMDALNAPTPAQSFLEHIASITGKSVLTVRSWAKGTRHPDLCAAKIIAQALGTDWQTLFPDKKEN